MKCKGEELTTCHCRPWLRRKGKEKEKIMAPKAKATAKAKAKAKGKAEPKTGHGGVLPLIESWE